MTDWHIFDDRVLILDGGMGTMIQQSGVDSSDYEGLNLTRPELIADIHREFIEAGADIIHTNTFGANRITRRVGACGADVAALCLSGARIAREAASAAPRKVLVAGSVGPTNVSLSLVCDGADPDRRPCSFDEMVQSFREQIGSLIEGGVDLILIESCFDLLNTKTALCALESLKGTSFPAIVSVSPFDGDGHTLTGALIEDFYALVKDYPLLAFGLNGTLGATEMIPLVKQLSAISRFPLICYPDAGIPDDLGHYEQKPILLSCEMRKMARKRMLNIAGGFNGASGEHICALATSMLDMKPRIPAKEDSALPKETAPAHDEPVIAPSVQVLPAPQIEEGAPRIGIVSPLDDIRDVERNATALALRQEGFDARDLGVLADGESFLQRIPPEGEEFLCICSRFPVGFSRTEDLCRLLGERKMSIPLFICGTASSALHTALILQPLYPHVFYAEDASACATCLREYLADREFFETAAHAAQDELADQYRIRKSGGGGTNLPANVQAVVVRSRANKHFRNRSFILTEKRFLHSKPTFALPLDAARRFFDWKYFLSAMGIKVRGRKGLRVTDPAGKKMLEDGRKLLQDIIEGKRMRIMVSIRIVDAWTDHGCICFVDNYRRSKKVRWPMLRQEEESRTVRGLSGKWSLCDFVPDKAAGIKGPFGFYAVALHDTRKNPEPTPLEKGIRETLLEAAGRWIEAFYRQPLCQYEYKQMAISRPVVGSPACPDRSLCKDLFEHLPKPKDLDIRLTDEGTLPGDSLFGLIIFHAQACCPPLGHIGPKQFRWYLKQRGLTEEKGRLFLEAIL